MSTPVGPHPAAQDGADAAPDGATPLIVNKGELAQVFDVSVPTVETWIREGCPVEQEGSNGKAYQFDVEKVRAWRKHIDDESAKALADRKAQLAAAQLALTGGGMNADDGTGPLTAKQRSEAIQAALLEDRLRRDRGELAEFEAVKADWTAVFQLLRQRTLALPVALKRTASLSDEQVRAVEREVRATLEAVSRQIANPDLRAAAEQE